MIDHYKIWADGFKALKVFRPPVEIAIKAVLTCYSQPIGKGDRAKRVTWSHASGYRKNSKHGAKSGEKEIEDWLFKKSPVDIVREKGSSLSLTVTDHNFPLSTQSKGQILCDALGFIEHRHKCHPIVIEVKVSDANPWFAVVENLIQIRMARFNLINIEKRAIECSLVDKHLEKARGTWGLVLAPRKYFYGHQPQLAAGLKLIQELKRVTEARIILATTDNLKETGRLSWVEGSYWPS